MMTEESATPDLDASASFGDLVRRYRVAAGLTQEELADRAGVGLRTVGDIERGVSGVPHRNTVAVLADALELTSEARAAFGAKARRRVSRLLAGDPASPVHTTQAGPWLGRPSIPPFIGRGRELELIQRHLREGAPPLLFFAGEPGIGKSRLLAEAILQARGRGWCVLRGGCQRRSQQPFAPLVGAFADFLRACSPSTSNHLLRGCRWLVRLLPELAERIDEALPDWVIAPDQERRLVFDAVARLLANLSREPVNANESSPIGVVMVLDDLQWAGGDAFELISSLVRLGSQSDHRWLRIVGAYRNNEVRPQDMLGIALADWAHAELVTHDTLPPLTLVECERLLDELLDDNPSSTSGTPADAAVRERVLQRSGGVPFFVVSYAHALNRGDVGAGADGVPWDVAQGVRQRVAGLPDPARSVLSAAAVVGRASDPALLSNVVGGRHAEVLSGLDAACQAQLLVDIGTGYQFSHDVIREVVEADLGSARRAFLHRQVGQATEALHREHLDEFYEALAHHYTRGQAWDQALHYLIRSGEKATHAGAIHEALAFYEQALNMCARLGRPAQSVACEVAEKRGFVSFANGYFEHAVTDYARMRTAAVLVGDRRREGLALAYGGMAAYYGHDFEAAESLLRHALHVSHEAYEEVRLSASIQLSAVLLVTGRHDEAAPFLRMAEDLAAKVDDPLSRSWWAITGSEVLHWSGQYLNALKLLERWQPAVVASNQMLMHLWTKWETALACGGSGDYSRALQLLNEVIVACAETGESFIRARALNTAGWLHCELQDHVRALELNAQSLALTDVIETADTEIANNARLNLGDSYFALGRLAEADEQYRAVEQIVRNPRPHDRWMVWRYSQHLFHSYGALSLARGRTDTALALANECLQTASTTNSPRNIVKARRLRGEVFMARADFAAARVELAQALEVARRLGNPPQLWRTLVAIGSACQAQQKGAAAHAAYREAVMVIERVASGLVDERVRSAFLGSSEVEDVRRRAGASLA